MMGIQEKATLYAKKNLGTSMLNVMGSMRGRTYIG